MNESRINIVPVESRSYQHSTSFFNALEMMDTLSPLQTEGTLQKDWDRHFEIFFHGNYAR